MLRLEGIIMAMALSKNGFAISLGWLGGYDVKKVIFMGSVELFFDAGL